MMADHRFENAYEYWERTAKRHLPNQIWYDDHLFQINSRGKSETDHMWTGYYRCVHRLCTTTVKKRVIWTLPDEYESDSKPHKCVEVIDLIAEEEIDYEVIDLTAE